ncbi:MAG: hypothetical protein INQ03_04730 [Candidatus Heimdallarchaeota archaeon]|nr:hypothetical protein [Candidatus Heimdallarchaeota archaeon]
MSGGTKTSDFGAPKRENHDSSIFYNSKLYVSSSNTKTADGLEFPLPDGLRNNIIRGDSRDLSEIPDLSIHLVITSPPYNVTKTYDDDLSLEEYLELIQKVVCFQHLSFCFSAFFILFSIIYSIYISNYSEVILNV